MPCFVIVNALKTPMSLQRLLSAETVETLWEPKRKSTISQNLQKRNKTKTMQLRNEKSVPVASEG
jgi:hypothetical protein